LVRDWRELRALRHRLGDGLRRLPREPTRSVLIVGLTGIADIVLQTPLITAFRLAGYRPMVVLNAHGAVAEATYRAVGVEEFIYHEDWLPTTVATPPMAPAPRLEDLLALRHGDVAVGRYAISWLMRRLRNGDPDLSGAHQLAVQAAVSEACDYAISSRAIVERHRPDAVLFLDHGYTPAGQLFDVALESGAACFTWNAAHRNGVLMLKRYGPENRDVHPSSLSPASWERLCAMRWTDEHWDRLRNEIEDCYRTGQWYGEVGTQIDKRFPTPEALKAELGLDPAKRTAVIFPHIFWDATFFWGTDLFRNYEEWFVESLKAACANDGLNWIVKVHPGNLVKDRRDGYRGEHSEITAIRKAVGALPPHVRVIEAGADVGTLALYRVLDYCLTVRGTVGIEAAAFGKNVVTAGTGRYDRLGFTTDPGAAGAYLDTLSRLETLPPPEQRRIELARRYAYGVFVARPMPLESIHFAYRQNETASLEVREKIDGWTMWSAPDIRAIAAWIETGDEDFLNPTVLGPSAADAGFVDVCGVHI
jgi:hypothetical protein